MQKLGILGVGHLATYTVRGLRNGGDTRPILLSPRSATVAQALAAECQCEVAVDNQSVIDQADIVLLSVRPDAIEGLLEGLQFRPEQIVVSVIAGLTLAQLRQFSNLQHTTLVRALPSASAEVNSGPVPLYPANPAVSALFSTLGEAVELSSEAQFDVTLSHACLHGWSYFLVQQLIDWSIRQGMDKASARKMVAHSIASAIEFGEARPEQEYGDIGRSIATPGTFTLLGQQHIDAENGYRSWEEAMQQVLDKAR